MACPECITGTLHTGTPTGTESTLHGLPTYIASPPSGTTPKGTIVIIPDAFGWTFNNSRILADSLATKGSFKVLLPDFMDGCVLDPKLLGHMDAILKKHDSWGAHSLQKGTHAFHTIRMFLPWMYRCGIKTTHPRVVGFMKKLRDEESLPIGVAGFCWGGKHVFKLASDAEKAAGGRSLVDAAFTAHPSFLTFPDDMNAVKIPLSVAVGTEDVQVPKAKISIVEESLKNCPAECEVKTYEGATHGFAVRANPENPKENDQGLEAMSQSIAWFDRHFP